MESAVKNDLSSRDLFRVNMSEGDFSRLSKLITSECGIKMPIPKKIMLESRLRKRLRVLGLQSFSEYCSYLFSSDGRLNELDKMIDSVTTNKTEFFREPRHFEYLSDKALPDLITKQKRGKRRSLKVWSAACSSGEEPYSLAMLLHEFEGLYQGFHYTITATDISTKVLKKAKDGIYPESRVDPVPLAFKKKYLLRSRETSKGLIRIVPDLRRRISFQKLNFMDEDYGITELMDIIFCRNVLIYFNRPTQEKMLKQVCKQLRPGGYLFVGHAETLNGMDLPITSVASSVYKKEE